jgi:Tetratricopeptide repeat
MAATLHLRALLLATGVAFSCSTVRGQSAPANDPPQGNPAPCTVSPQPQPCAAKPAKSTAASPSAAEKFPFPGEDGEKSPRSGSSPSGEPTPAARKSAQDAFPFPGEDPATPLSPGSGPSSSSSSSSDDGTPDPAATPGPAGASPAQSGLADKGSEGAQQPGRHILHRVNPIGTKLQSDDEREAEDLDVAHFYTQTGDLQGAYLRTQDAVKIAPDDPDAHFALAEIARKLDKREEAIAEYNTCLKLDPDPNEAGAARKAVARLHAPAK